MSKNKQIIKQGSKEPYLRLLFWAWILRGVLGSGGLILLQTETFWPILGDKDPSRRVFKAKDLGIYRPKLATRI